MWSTFAFYEIMQSWNRTGGCNRSLWNTRSCLSSTVNNYAGDVLEMYATRASASMELNWFFADTPVWESELSPQLWSGALMTCRPQSTAQLHFVINDNTWFFLNDLVWHVWLWYIKWNEHCQVNKVLEFLFQFNFQSKSKYYLLIGCFYFSR